MSVEGHWGHVWQRKWVMLFIATFWKINEQKGTRSRGRIYATQDRITLFYISESISFITVKFGGADRGGILRVVLITVTAKEAGE